MSDLIERLRNGVVCHPKRWSGDTHDDLGGTIKEAETDALLNEAADEIERLRKLLLPAPLPDTGTMTAIGDCDDHYVAKPGKCTCQKLDADSGKLRTNPPPKGYIKDCEADRDRLPCAYPECDCSVRLNW